MSSSSYLIGITGGSASGKTLFLNELVSQFDEGQICVISQDNYYYKRELQLKDGNGIYNFDRPESINEVEFARDIKLIKEGQPFERTEYTFNNPAKSPENLYFKPSPIVIIEGLFVTYFKDVNELLDLRIYLDVEDHIRLKRRIIRDNHERGYDLEDVLYRFENHVMPTYKRYIRPLKSNADIVIPNNSSFDNALQVISGFIKNRLKN